MRVFSCILCKDEFFSDAYPYTKIFEDACYEVKGAWINKGSDQIAIASDDIIEDEEGERVINIVDANTLQELTLSKKDLMGWAK